MRPKLRCPPHLRRSRYCGMILWGSSCEGSLPRSECSIFIIPGFWSGNCTLIDRKRKHCRAIPSDFDECRVSASSADHFGASAEIRPSVKERKNGRIRLLPHHRQDFLPRGDGLHATELRSGNRAVASVLHVDPPESWGCHMKGEKKRRLPAGVVAKLRDNTGGGAHKSSKSYRRTPKHRNRDRDGDE